MTETQKYNQLSGLQIGTGLFERFMNVHSTDVVGRIGQALLKDVKTAGLREQKAMDDGNYTGVWPSKYARFGKLADIKIDHLSESLNTNFTIGDYLKEDLTFDSNTGLYTTIITQFIEQAIQTKLLSNGILKVISGINPSGANAIKVPLQVHHTAGTLGNDADITTSRTEQNYGSTTLTAVWYYTSAGMTQELMTHSVADLMKDQLISMGYALGKNMDEVIIAALETATPSNDSNTNYNALGGSVKMNWDDLTKYLGNMEAEHDTVPSCLIVNPNTWANMLQDDDIRTGIQYASQIAALAPGFWPRAPGVTCQLLDMDVIVTSLASAKNLYMVDKEWAGYFAPFVPLSVVDGRISGKLAWEVVAYQAFAATVTQTPSVFRLKELT